MSYNRKPIPETRARRITAEVKEKGQCRPYTRNPFFRQSKSYFSNRVNEIRLKSLIMNRIPLQLRETMRVE